MSRYEVCPLSPGNLYWQAFGHNSHLRGAAHQPVKTYKTAAAAKRYAIKHAHDFNYGLCVVDTKEELVDWGGTSNLDWEDPRANDAEEE